MESQINLTFFKKIKKQIIYLELYLLEILTTKYMLMQSIVIRLSAVKVLPVLNFKSKYFPNREAIYIVVPSWTVSPEKRTKRLGDFF